MSTSSGPLERSALASSSSASKGRAWAPAPGLWRIPHLEAFLPEHSGVDRWVTPVRPISCALGWGRKPTSAYARWAARRIGVPYVALEDGFIRSVAGGRAGAPPIALVADDVGVHYDATRPSELERMIASSAPLTRTAREEANELLAIKARFLLSKYNSGRPVDVSLIPATTRERILVLDQVRGDASIAHSLADPGAFDEMLKSARQESPHAQIILKRHPMAGQAQSSVSESGLALADVIIDANVNIVDLISRVDRVFTVSSLAGFEAVVCGKPVTCFGLPFYAGWGVTQDRVSTNRRKHISDVIEIFAAAYMRYSRYVDPLTGKACDARTAFLRLAGYKSHVERVRGDWAALNIAPAKRAVVRRFFGGPASRVSFPSSLREARHAVDGGARLLVWASRTNSLVDAMRSQFADRIVQIEDGFLRSAGLGSSFYPASSLIMDVGGVYFDPSSRSDLEQQLLTADFPSSLLLQAAQIRRQVVATGLSKYNLKYAGAFSPPESVGRKRIFVPGQVENDASVLRGGAGWTNLRLLKAVRAKNPGAWILYKEHPDVTAGNRPGRIPAESMGGLADHVVADADVAACISTVDAVHVLTSLAGFEALLRNKQVVTYGTPFYAGWGLTTDVCAPSRGRVLSLDQLVAGALVFYPLYLDPQTQLPVDATTFVQRLILARDQMQGSGMTRRPFGSLARFAKAIGEVIASPRPPVY